MLDAPRQCARQGRKVHLVPCNTIMHAWKISFVTRRGSLVKGRQMAPGGLLARR